jgi:hypothetical protein
VDHDARVTRDQFAEVFGSPQSVAAAGAATTVGGIVGAPAAPPASGDADPTLTLNGNNPVAWQEGTPWQDNLGALFTYDGISETIYSTSTIDLSVSGTSTVDYWAVVPWSQQVLHATRAVVVEGAANDSLSPPTEEQSSHDDSLPVASSTPPATNDNPPPLETTGTAAEYRPN